MGTTATILLIEGKRTSKKLSFAIPLQRRYEVLVAHTGTEALQLLHDKMADVVILNAPSMRTSGQRICNMLRRHKKELLIIHIKTKGSKTKTTVEADMVLYLPFTVRKLMNRIENFISARDGEVLEAGPFRMNLKSRILFTDSSEIRLTPKLAVMFELFMRHPNKVLERSFLMEKVWQTDYLGDTRTLDVHIRWIREAIEQKPSRPIYLRTIRGKGYMLDLDETQRSPA